MGYLTLKRQAVPTSPASGKSSIYVDTADSRLKYVDNAGSIRKPSEVLASLGANATISTEAVICAALIKGGTVAVGDTFLIRAAGQIGAAAGDPTWRIRVGTSGTTADAAAWTSTAATGVINTPIWFDGIVTIKAAGGSGSLVAEALAVHGATPHTRAVGALPAAISRATDVDWYIVLTVAFSANSHPITAGRIWT